MVLSRCPGGMLDDQRRREKSLRPTANPEGDLAVGLPKLQVVHDEARLPGSVHVQGRSDPRDHDSDGRPRARLKVGIGFVHARAFIPEAKPRIVRVRHVLGGVIAAQLIVGAAVRRTQEEALELMCGRVDPKGDTDKPAGILRSVSPRHAGNLDLNHPILEFGAGHQRDGLIVRGVLVGLDQPDSPPASIGNHAGLDKAQVEGAKGVQLECLSARCGHAFLSRMSVFKVGPAALGLAKHPCGGAARHASISIAPNPGIRPAELPAQHLRSIVERRFLMDPRSTKGPLLPARGQDSGEGS